ncbi:hypothetical protein AMS68_003762 [Peltaster fructicola]|uniref:Patatin-like phospholipase domain-containing protein n=1 Tax=Peltaster fructicola TaxID=286661 RepID=A0A6H0XUC0_9PEZI|nr:hypothetical protein AMS68_003762 [Peltaster fructicola]
MTKEKISSTPSIDSKHAWNYRELPDWDNDFVDEDDIAEFAKALIATPDDPLKSEEDLTSPKPEFITALNDWKPVHQRVKGTRDTQRKKKSKRRKKPERGKDETREGWSYPLLKYPLLIYVIGWIILLGVSYLFTRLYIYLYEHFFSWRGKKNKLRHELHEQVDYLGWTKAASVLDTYLGNDAWKEDDVSSYYQYKTIKRILKDLRALRLQAEKEEKSHASQSQAMHDLRSVLEACVKNNFAGFEDSHLYSETYYGTKNLIQEYVNEVQTTLQFLLNSRSLTQDAKHSLAQHFSTNFGRTALCLSGGATFAYYHFGIAKALIEDDSLPDIITGTSGGALVAALLGTRTDEELRKLLVPALAYRIKACQEPISIWFWRWYKTGARFDNVDWAKKCAWFCHGSLTFMEAYKRTGRVLNVSCVPSDPHSPSILANYLTAPDCVVWSAVLASAAVPGILNPVVLMRKTLAGKLEPYSFGHKWKDGSLRTDIPLQSLNLHFNVNFSIVSQVNPHVNLFFFSSRGTVGRPVTHRQGRGWRGGFIGSAAELYLKTDLTKWLKFLRHLELLPRPMGQDWSQVFLQRFGGTITIWPKTRISDFWNILSDPDMNRLSSMIHQGQLAGWPKLKFIDNRMKIERVIEKAREATRPSEQPLPTPAPGIRLRNMFSEDDLKDLLEKARQSGGSIQIPEQKSPVEGSRSPRPPPLERQDSPSFSRRVSEWFGSSRASMETSRPSIAELGASQGSQQRRGSFMEEFRNQSSIFFDDPDMETADEGITDDDVLDTEDEAHYMAGSTSTVSD